MLEHNTDTTEIIRLLGLVTEPHCRTAAMAAEVIREQAAEIKRLQKDVEPVALMASEVDK